MSKIKEYYHAEIEAAMRDTRWFRANNMSDKLNGSKVDFEKGVIEGVAVCTVGEALGHGVWLEQSFIDDIVKFGNATKSGIKARFGHPNMSGESLGTFIGRFQNFKVDGIKAVADLKMSDVAKKSPNGDLYSYILEMADSNPEDFGASIVFSVKENYFYDSEGNREKVKWGEYGISNDSYDGQKIYVEMKSLNGTDLVDEPAANPDGLFSSTVLHGDKFAVIATQFLNSNPKIAEFLQENPHKINEFMKKFNEGKVGDATPEKTPVAETKPTVKPVAETKPVETDGDGEDAAKGDESLLSKFGAMLDDKLGKMETKFQTALDGIEKRVKDMEEDPNATPTFSSPKADKQPEVVKPKKSWDVEYEKRHGGIV
jgi:hypothetical protein